MVAEINHCVVNLVWYQPAAGFLCRPLTEAHAKVNLLAVHDRLTWSPSHHQLVSGPLVIWKLVMSPYPGAMLP